MGHLSSSVTLTENACPAFPCTFIFRPAAHPYIPPAAPPVAAGFGSIGELFVIVSQSAHDAYCFGILHGFG
jgi:hypothetical protein